MLLRAAPLLALCAPKLSPHTPITPLMKERDPLPEEPNDALKVIFSREPNMPENFLPQETTPKSKNQALIDEIQSLMPDQKPTKPETQAVDLNGITPTDLLIGASSYLCVALLAWQFTSAAGEYFALREIDTSVYYVARLTSLVRAVVVGMGALGAGITTIAGLGQLALAVHVSMLISQGELDPTAERKLPQGGRKMGETERLFRMMRGEEERRV